MRFTLILGLFLLLTANFQAFAAYQAMVKATTATIYADIDLKAPIGKLSQGSKIKIAEKLRRHGTVAISSHQNRLVYLSTKDLTISEVKGQVEAEYSRFKVIEVEAIANEPKAHRASVSLYGGRGVPGQSWTTLADQMQSTETQSFYTLGVGLKFNPFSSRYSVSANMEATNSFDPMVQLQLFAFDASLHFSLLNNSLLSWDIFAGPAITPNILIQTENKQFFTKGAGYGYRIGSEVHLLNFWKYHLSAGALYRYQRLNGHEEIQLPGPYRQLTSLNDYSEYRLYLALNRDLKF